MRVLLKSVYHLTCLNTVYLNVDTMLILEEMKKKNVNVIFNRRLIDIEIKLFLSYVVNKSE